MAPVTFYDNANQGANLRGGSLDTNGESSATFLSSTYLGGDRYIYYYSMEGFVTRYSVEMYEGYETPYITRIIYSNDTGTVIKFDDIFISPTTMLDGLGAVLSQDDTIYGNSFSDDLLGFAGNDTIYGGEGNDTVGGDSGDDILFGGGGNDSISGGSGDDGMFGGEGNDYIYGGSGSDGLGGQQGNDTLYGGAGNDIFHDTSGADNFYGGDGQDTVSFEEYSGKVVIDLKTGANNGNDYYNSIEHLSGSNVAGDRLTGDDGENRLLGLGGNDRLYGGRGNDTLDGGAGNDYFIDISGADHFIGGSGQDTVSFYGRSSSININLQTGVNNSGDTYSSIEHLNGSNRGSDRLTGDDGANMLRGFGGNDTLEGGAGDDTLDGGSGADVFVFRSGSGDDTISNFNDGTDVLAFASELEGDIVVTNSDEGAVLTIGSADTVLLSGVDAAVISISDFEFI